MLQRRAAPAPPRLPRSPAGRRRAAARRARAHLTVGVRALGHHFAVARQPREAMRLGDGRERCRARRCRAGRSRVRRRRGRLSVAVTWMSSGLRCGPSASAIAQRLRWRRRGRARGSGSGRSARCDARAQRGKADRQHVVRAAPGVEARRGGGPRRARRSDRRPGPRRRPARAPRRRDRASRRDSARRPVLQRAAAADAEMRADRRDALGACAARSERAVAGRGRRAGSTSAVSPGSA